MDGDMGHMGGLINPRPAGFSNTGGSPKPRKRAPCQKNHLLLILFKPKNTDVGKLSFSPGRLAGLGVLVAQKSHLCADFPGSRKIRRR